MEFDEPATAAHPVIEEIEADDFFAISEEEATYVLLPRLGIGLGESHAVFADGSYATWIPTRLAGIFPSIILSALPLMDALDLVPSM